jgi:hypothetical protein
MPEFAQRKNFSDLRNAVASSPSLLLSSFNLTAVKHEEAVFHTYQLMACNIMSIDQSMLFEITEIRVEHCRTSDWNTAEAHGDDGTSETHGTSSVYISLIH